MSDQHQGLSGVTSSQPDSVEADVGEVNHMAQLASDLAALCRTEEFSDIVLVVDGHRLAVHKSILAARSEYFRALLFGGLKESQESEIALSGAAIEPFRILLQYVYSGQISLTGLKEETILDILGLAHQYGFCQLQEVVSQYLERAVRSSNVCLIYDVASLYQLKPLLTVCRWYMDRHAATVLRHANFCQLSASSLREVVSRDSFCAPELDIFEAVGRWVESNPGQDCTAIVDALRLPLLDMRDLVGVVRSSSVVRPDRILDAVRDKVESRDRDLQHRGCLYLDENVCTPALGAKATRGDMRHYLINGNSSSYDMEHGFARCAIDPNSHIDNCIQVQLGTPCIVNHVRFLLWDRDSRSYSYLVNVSSDGQDWVTVADYSQYLCRSWQFVYFPPRSVRHIRLVGCKNTVNRMFHVVTLEAYYISNPEPVQDSLIVPRGNVATLSRSAVVVEGVSRSRHALLNGDTDKYDWDHGYTCHQLGSGCVVVQLGQPVLVDSMRLLLWDCDDRSYGFYIEVSTDQRTWNTVFDRSASSCRSWQHIQFTRQPVVFIRIVGTRNTANEVFHCVHFECPAVVGPGCSGIETTSSMSVEPDQSNAAAAVEEPQRRREADEEGPQRFAQAEGADAGGQEEGLPSALRHHPRHRQQDLSRLERHHRRHQRRLQQVEAELDELVDFGPEEGGEAVEQMEAALEGEQQQGVDGEEMVGAVGGLMEPRL